MDLPKFPPPEPGVQMRTMETMEEYVVSVLRCFPFYFWGGGEEIKKRKCKASSAGDCGRIPP